MALSLDELVEKYKAGTMTDAELTESGHNMDQVESLAKNGDDHGSADVFVHFSAIASDGYKSLDE